MDDEYSGDVCRVGDAIIKAKAAAKAGFKRFVVPLSNQGEVKKGAPKKLEVKGVSTLMDALYEGFEHAPKPKRLE